MKFFFDYVLRRRLPFDPSNIESYWGLSAKNNAATALSVRSVQKRTKKFIPNTGAIIITMPKNQPVIPKYRGGCCTSVKTFG
jgi:hypothetical protein